MEFEGGLEGLCSQQERSGREHGEEHEEGGEDIEGGDDKANNDEVSVICVWCGVAVRFRSHTNPKQPSRDSSGLPILTLPPITSRVVTVTLTPPERNFYEELFQQCSATFDGIVSSGNATKSMIMILALLMKLRQTCNHVKLAQGHENENDKKATSSVSPAFLAKLMSKYDKSDECR